jgi:integrase
MKYVTKLKNGGFIFSPPQAAIDAGVVKRKYYKDGRSYRYEVPKFIAIIEEWRKGKLSPELLSSNSTLLEASAFYQNSRRYLDLSKNTKNNYRQILGNACGTKAFKFGKLKIKDLSVRLCNMAYEEWLETSVPAANQTARVMSVLFNFLCSLDLLPSNPMARVYKTHHEPSTTIWSREEVDKFLSVAFSKYEWRNVGLITYLCYEWGQRPTDIYNLKWDNLNFETGICTLTQSKRGATVYLPITDALVDMLGEQRKIFDFQEYIAPNFRPSHNAYRPYDASTFNKIFREIKEEAGLPEHLKVGTLRKTAINEARDGGASVMDLQQFTGHKNLSSLNPYMKFTPTGAKNALDRRK